MRNNMYYFSIMQSSFAALKSIVLHLFIPGSPQLLEHDLFEAANLAFHFPFQYYTPFTIIAMNIIFYLAISLTIEEFLRGCYVHSILLFNYY